MWDLIYLSLQIWWWVAFHTAVACGLGSCLRNREHSAILKAPLSVFDRRALFCIALLWPITVPLLLLGGLYRRCRREATWQELMDETIGYICQKFRRDYQCPVCLHRWESDTDIPGTCPECETAGLLPKRAGNIWS